MKFPCRLCGHDVTITEDDRAGWGLYVLHECGLGPETGTGYSFLDFEVQILGGFEEACRRILLEEYRDPQCQYVAGKRMLSSEFTLLKGHHAPWSRELVDRLLEEGWPERNPPPEHKLSLEKNEAYGDEDDIEYYIKCLCGDVWPLLGNLTAVNLPEGTSLNREQEE